MDKDINRIFSLSYTEAKNIVVCGDIHGDFNKLIYKMCVQYQMKDTLLVVAGDCGFGFDQKGYYENIVRQNSKRMNEANNWIVFVRGNHDNPAYFDGVTFKHKRMIAVPDYSVINACGHHMLCVGGAISIDRSFRIKEWNRRKFIFSKSYNQDDLLARNLYWPDEQPVLDKTQLSLINQSYKIDLIVTHTAPSFCELIVKNNLDYWVNVDDSLLIDMKKEREVMTQLYEYLVENGHPITNWCYGHFHQSWHSSINEIMFSMLDIMEFKSGFDYRQI